MNELRQVFNDALLKYERGENKYGQYNPKTDQRDLLIEAEAELLDALNYVAMHLLKLRAMRAKNSYDFDFNH